MNHDQYIHKVALHLVSKNTLQGLKFLISKDKLKAGNDVTSI